MIDQDFKKALHDTLRRSLLAAIPIATVVGLTVGAYAAIKVDFKANTPISSGDMNGNFTEIDTRLKALEAKTAIRSEVVLDSANARGSASTQVVRFQNVTKTGTAFTVTQNSANGDSITINEDGIYALSSNGRSASGGGWEIDINSTNTSFGDYTHSVMYDNSPTSNQAWILGGTRYLPAGTVVRVLSGSLVDPSTGWLAITKINN